MKPKEQTDGYHRRWDVNGASRFMDTLAGKAMARISSIETELAELEKEKTLLQIQIEMLRHVNSVFKTQTRENLEDEARGGAR